MKLPHAAFTTRRLMVAVAVAALGVGGWCLRERRNHHLRLALKHQVLAEIFGKGHAHFGANPALAARHEALRARHQRAATYPWLPVEPDPPTP